MLFLLVDKCYPVNYEKEYSVLIKDSNDELISAYLTADDKWRMFEEINDISPELSKAFIHKEDKYFYYHPGVNPIAIARAAFNNAYYGRRTSGASTITMQVVRLLHPRPRTISSKFKEMFAALQLEWHLSKKEILQLYLNLAPYGGNIEGVKAAALLYFNKFPEQLSLAELTTLTIIPNRPSSLRLGKNNAYIIEERNKQLRRFAKKKVFRKEAIETALNEKLDAKRRSIENKAPHFSERIRKEQECVNCPSTLDLNLQQNVNNLLTIHMNQWKEKQVFNASVMVIDNKSRHVKCYLGSNDFYDNEHGGQVDGILGVRSPGSTLKPLIYGLAFDEGIVTPKTIIHDTPIEYGGYAPENYNEKFHGKVSIAYSLAHSLNIPAVKLLQLLTTNRITELLSELNFETIRRQKTRLGLSLALGGCGANLEEISAMYAMIANQGQYAPLQTIENDADSLIKSQAILSNSSTYMLSQILSEIDRPEYADHAKYIKNIPKIAWKTGTSYGRRDAWCFGYNADYTVGVWVGNFSGIGSPHLVGAEAATPLLLKIFSLLQRNSSADWFHMPEELDFRYVCSSTGLRPNTFCQDEVLDYFLPTISNEEVCQHQKRIWTDEAESISYCTNCLPEKGYKEKFVDNISGDLIAYYKTNKIPFEEIPPHNNDCQRLFTDHAPNITHPSDGVEYFISKEEETLMLKCETHNDVSQIFWYVDDVYVGKSTPTTSIFIQPKYGEIKISCTDDQGRNTDIKIKLREL